MKHVWTHKHTAMNSAQTPSSCLRPATVTATYTRGIRITKYSNIETDKNTHTHTSNIHTLAQDVNESWNCLQGAAWCSISMYAPTNNSGSNNNKLFTLMLFPGEFPQTNTHTHTTLNIFFNDYSTTVVHGKLEVVWKKNGEASVIDWSTHNAIGGLWGMLLILLLLFFSIDISLVFATVVFCVLFFPFAPPIFCPISNQTNTLAIEIVCWGWIAGWLTDCGIAVAMGIFKSKLNI